MQIDWGKIFSYINGQTDKKTVEEVEFWRKEDPRNEEFYQRASDYYANQPTRNESFSEEKLDQFYSKLQKTRRQKHQRVLWQRMTVAASVILLLSLGTWWYYDMNPDKMDGMQIAMKSENAGESVFIITETGDKLTAEQLNSKMDQQTNDNQLNYTKSDSIYRVDTVKEKEIIPTHTVVVPRGKTFELVLSDGTFVLLNPESELTYPVKFDSTSVREVTLRGEGYFEVTKSSNRFVVNTDNMKLQVYGTTFNVISRDNLPDEAVLVEGVVGITPKNSSDGKETVLHPGDKSSVDKLGQVSVTQTDLAEYTAKRNGYILFNGKTIKQVISSLELYYDVHFLVKNGAVLEKEEYVFSIKQYASLREALDVIEFVSDVKFLIEGKEVKIVE
ncbi:FecR family protein [Butyricimonas virosa]|uniref:FecR family protein n=1 Tax=Butyricimonas virosa TaxID=544645 RepID=UPI000E4383CB|nr:FecR family protein [Butyricimonas virosa]RGL90766.1 FecR family protein [Butyricimonas virosa]